MTAEFIQHIIQNECEEFDIIVLKGFSPDLIFKLGESFLLIDHYVLENGKIILENINENRLMLSIIGCTPGTKAICTCESLIKMCTQITGLDILQKKICVLDNNMLDLYPNPSNADIPDFDSEDFMDTENDSALYSIFYSFCIRENDQQKIQYIYNYADPQNSCITIKRLIEPKPYKIINTTYDTDPQKLISTKNGSLSTVMEELYHNMTLTQHQFSVEIEEMEEEGILTLINAAKIMKQKIQISKISRNLNVTPRNELTDLLHSIWGYNSFRNLKIYKELNINQDIEEISQGSIIEMVIKQAEYALQGKKECVNNILLTSPTGAGKSLLFQLSAIYLAEKYGLLTIVVSPLVALMNDQVEGLYGYNAVAALNSNKTATEKEMILQGVQKGSINILYLSPELLLSYSISTFLGKRQLGLMVVDEAHTVTTWGRDFRVDYWFLGDYIRKSKRYLPNTFPIFALTATAVWDPSGHNDMVFDTIRSLNMDPCIKYIGAVRRENISFEIESSSINKSYEEERRKKTIQRIREALNNDKKTIVYFPFKRTVNSIVYSEDISDIKDKVTWYHAALNPEEKRVNAEDFRNGNKPIMCATKAFGMGIDVSDIQEVYHHAPTGCLSDYVQEIGRLARDPQIKGIAKIDFSEKDFRYIRKLHGLSAIKPYQLMQVLKKLMAIYRLNGEKRNMLISASDFAYIFPHTAEDSIDQNLKSCLLLLSHDLLNKLRFHALIVRPKSLFSKNFIEVPINQTKDFYRIYYPYLKHVNQCTYVLNADKIWTEQYSNISFPRFKAKLAEGKIFKDFQVEIKNKITVCLHQKVEDVHREIEFFFQLAHKFLNEMSTMHHRISFDAMKKALPASFDSMKREQFLETFRMLYATPLGLGGDIAAYCSIFTSQEGKMQPQEAFQCIQNGYENVKNLYVSTYNKNIHERDYITYCNPKDDIVKLCEFLNSLGLADYQRLGGDLPAIFVRINNPYYLNMMIRSKKYENDILKNIYDKYVFSEEIFTYFFNTPMTDQQRWDFIEAYFLGASKECLLNFI